MAKKIALMGFSRVKLFPVVKNNASEYSVGEGFELPWAQEMTREADTSESKIYADDILYMNFKSWNGLNSTIKLAEMPLEMMAKLGFGVYDPAGKTLKWNPQGENKEFALSLRQLRADGSYRMQKMFSFTVNEVKESNIKSKGEGNDLNSYQLIGTFSARIADGLPGEIKDSEEAGDLSWLDTVDSI